IPVSRSIGPPLQPFPNLSDEVHTVAFDAAGTTLLTCGFAGARLWDSVSGSPRGPDRFFTGYQPATAAISPDGKLVGFGEYRGLAQLYDATTGETLHQAYGLMRGTVSPTPFSPDGRWWLTASPRDTESVLLPSGSCLWDVSKRPLQPQLFLRKLKPIVMSAAFHPNDQTLV